MNIISEQNNKNYGHDIHFPTKEEFVEGCSKLKHAIRHNLARAAEVIKKSTLVIKVARVALEILSYISALAPHLEWAETFLKDVKTLTQFIKGLHLIDRMATTKLSGKTLLAKISTIAFYIFGSIKFVFNSIKLGEKFLIDFSAIKTALKAIPIFGALSYGGILPLATIGLLSARLASSVDKRNGFNASEMRIKEKISLWQHPLEAAELQRRQKKYEQKINGLQKETDLAFEEKKSQWDYLNTHFKEIPQATLHSFQKAKLAKWQAKLHKLDKEKNANVLSIVKSVVGVAEQILLSATTLTGVGLLVVPFASLGLDLISIGLSIASKLLKHSAKELKIEPVLFNPAAA